MTTRIAFTAADLEAARRSVSCHKTQFPPDAMARLAEAAKPMWNGIVSLYPAFGPSSQNDLFRERPLPFFPASPAAHVASVKCSERLAQRTVSTGPRRVREGSTVPGCLSASPGGGQSRRRQSAWDPLPDRNRSQRSASGPEVPVDARPQTLGEFVAVHDGEPDVEQCDVGAKIPYAFQCRRPIVRRGDVIPEALEHLCEHLRCVPYVVHNQHARASRLRNTDAWLDRRFDCGTAKRRYRQLDDEVTAVARTRALRSNRSSVQIHEHPGDGETQAQSAARAVDRLPLLNICVEYGVEQFRRNTKPFVLHPELKAASRLIRADENAGFSITVFRGIREQVGDDLCEAFPGRRPQGRASPH